MVNVAKQLDAFVWQRLDQQFEWGAHDCFSVWYEEWCRGILGIGAELIVAADHTDAAGALRIIQANGARSLGHLIEQLLAGHEVPAGGVLLGDLCVVETGAFAGSLKTGLGVILGNGCVLVLAERGFAQLKRQRSWKCYGRRD